jgi:hypothetical protein
MVVIHILFYNIIPTLYRQNLEHMLIHFNPKCLQRLVQSGLSFLFFPSPRIQVFLHF